MAMAVDPYSKWLNIPEGPRPPAPHELLGLRDGTTDAKIIDLATERRMDQLDRYALSSDREVREQVQQLMNEIAKARTQLIAKASVQAPLAPSPPPAPAAVSKRITKPTRVKQKPVSRPSPQPTAQPAKRPASFLPDMFWLLLISGWALSIVVVGGITYILASPTAPDPDLNNPLAAQVVPVPEPAVQPKPKPVEPTPIPEPEPRPEPEPEPEPRPQPKPEPKPAPKPDPQIAKPEPLKPGDYSEDLKTYFKERDSLARDPEAQVALIQEKISEVNGGITVHIEWTQKSGRLANFWLIGEQENNAPAHENKKIRDLSPLAGLEVSYLRLNDLEQVQSFDFLKTMRMSSLTTSGNNRLDLDTVGQIKGLTGFFLRDIRGTDFKLFKGRRMNGIDCSNVIGLKSLDGLEGMRLTSLYINDCPTLTDISALSTMTITYGLGFKNTPITDITPITKVRQLKALFINDCPNITSLKGLEASKALHTLEINGTGVSEAEIEQVKWKLPKLRGYQGG